MKLFIIVLSILDSDNVILGYLPFMWQGLDFFDTREYFWVETSQRFIHTVILERYLKFKTLYNLY